jgi:Rod binding domain-containing protein
VTGLSGVNGLSTASGLGPIDQSVLPTEVRNGTKADKERYTAALGFEKLLVTQLAKQLADTTKPTGDSSDEDGASGSSAATETYRQMLPDALAGAIAQAGGLGLAQTIYKQLPSSAAGSDSGTSA